MSFFSVSAPRRLTIDERVTLRMQNTQSALCKQKTKAVKQARGISMSISKTTAKHLFLVLAMCGVITLGGCATANSGSTTSETDENSAVKEATITTRSVTFPAAYFQEKTEEEARAALESNGANDVVVNEDGSYTVTMSIDTYNELVDALHQSTKELLDGIPNSEDYPSITSVEYDNTFSAVTLISSVQELGFSEMFVGWAAGLSSNMYQQISGQPVNCTVTVLGPDGSAIQSGVYPDDFGSAETTEAH